MFFNFHIYPNQSDRRTERQTHICSLATLTPTTKTGDGKRLKDRNQIKQKHFFMRNLEFRGQSSAISGAATALHGAKINFTFFNFQNKMASHFRSNNCLNQ